MDTGPLPFERFPPWPRAWRWPHLWVVGAVGVLALLSDAAVGEPPWGLVAAYMLGIAVLPPAIHVGFRLLNGWGGQLTDYVKEDSGEVSCWVTLQLEEFRDTRAAATVGAGVAVASLVAHGLAGVFDATIPAALLVAFSVFTAAFMTGVALWYMFLMNRLVWRAGTRFPLRTYFSASLVFETGAVLSRIHVLAAVAWMSVTWAVILDPRVQIVVALIALPVACGLGGSFITVQVPLHQQLLAHKRSELRRIDDAISRLRDGDLAKLSEQQREQIEFLKIEGERIQALPDWPFRWRNVVTLGASLAASLVPPAFGVLLEPAKREELARLLRLFA